MKSGDHDGVKRNRDKQNAAVIGLGRFGLFWAEMLAGEYNVLGTSRRVIADLPSGVRQVEMNEALQADVIFLTVSISALSSVLEHIAPQLPPGVTVVDTCSVKVYPAREMERLLPKEVDIIACHPMFGPDSAGERTDPLPVITWPIRDDHGRYDAIRALFRRLNMRVVEMAPDQHDREAAFSQGVTHFVGRILKEMDLQTSPIATLGYTRLLQVMEQTCNDPLQLFRDLQQYNPYTRDMRRRFADALHATESVLLDAAKKEQ